MLRVASGGANSQQSRDASGTLQLPAPAPPTSFFALPAPNRGGEGLFSPTKSAIPFPVTAVPMTLLGAAGEASRESVPSPPDKTGGRTKYSRRSIHLTGNTLSRHFRITRDPGYLMGDTLAPHEKQIGVTVEFHWAHISGTIVPRFRAFWAK